MTARTVILLTATLYLGLTALTGEVRASPDPLPAIHAGSDAPKPRSRPILRLLGKVARKAGGAVDRRADQLDHSGQTLKQRRGLTRGLGTGALAASKVLRSVAGTETLLNTSFDGALGAGIGVPFLLNTVNAKVGVSGWSGSIAYHENGIKDVMFNYGGGFNTPNFSAGYTKLTKLMFSGPFPLISGFKGQRGHGICFGAVGACSLSFGEIGPGNNSKGEWAPGRGPFVEVAFGIPLAWGLVPSAWLNFLPEKWRSGPMLGGAFSLYGPMLRFITRPMERPAAFLDRNGKRVTEWGKRRAKKLAGVVFRRGEKPKGASADDQIPQKRAAQ